MENKTNSFESISEIEAIVKGFEQCTLPPAEFHHRQHLTVALWYTLEDDEQTALARMREGLFRFVAHHKLDPLYHETITLFWLKWIRSLLESGDRERPIEELANEIISKCGGSGFINTYFSKECLESDKARREWVEPDLRPLF
jgi:hypothetical protein